MVVEERAVESGKGPVGEKVGDEGEESVNGEDVIPAESGMSPNPGAERLKVLLTERIPVLGGIERRLGGAVGERDGKGRSGWAEKTVEVRRALGRWFRFRQGPWDGSQAGNS